MKRTRIFCIFLFLAGCILPASIIRSANPTPPAAKPAPAKMTAPSIEVIEKPWTGDLDGMQKRRIIRVLTVYSKTYYFVDKGQPRGLAYDALKAFEESLNKKAKTGSIQVHVIMVPVSRGELLPGLAQGKGDIAMAGLTITPERMKTVDFTDPTLKGVNEILVTGPSSPAIATVDDLSGNVVYVRKSSSYYESLVTLNDQFRKQGKPEVSLKIAPENLEDEDLIEMLNAGLVKFIVVDDSLARFWSQIFPKVTLRPDIVIRSEGDLAWAIRQNSPLLKAELNSFIKRNGKGTLFGNTLIQKYLKSVKYVKNAASDAELKKFFQTVTLIQKYSDEYRVDALLMAAQGYQESRLDQSVKSPVGAVGVMQVMPATGKDMNVGDITRMEPNIDAGVKYMRFMIDQYYKNEPMDDFNKLIFAFASYNAGPARIRQMRQIAAQRGYDKNLWFNNVERIAAEKIGRETVTYVSNIYKYYLAYQMILEEKEARDKAKKEASSTN